VGRPATKVSPEDPPAKAAPRRPAADDTVRVPVAKLDQTIRLMEELSSAQLAGRHRVAELRRLRGSLRKVLGRVSGGQDTSWLQADLAAILAGLDHQVREERDLSGNLDRLTAALQQQALEIRLMPIGELFGTLPRAVRDIASQLDKRVRLELAGLDIELDKRVLEGLRAPLVHLVRNAIDHGIETPEQRQGAGKEPEARLAIRASSHGGRVEVAVEDDGRGIDVDKVRRTGLARGVLPADRAEVASEREVLQLLFLPGFSTAREVTDLSGRGVGLDVVKSHIEELKGDVTVETTEGRGTVFRLTVPVSLTLQTILRARADDREYAFPHSFVEEARPISPLDLIEVAGQPALRLGNQLIPLVDLAETLGQDPAPRRRVAIIGQAAGERVAFGVDAVEEIEEVVIKPVPRGIRAPLVGGFCSAEHGRIVPVLHIPSLIKAVWAIGSRRLSATRAALREPRRILVVDDSPNTREVIRTILENAGFSVDTAKDGEEALLRLDRQMAHLVVTDIEMPRLDGFSLCRRLREQPDTAGLPIVLVTSRATDADRRRGAEVGANAYIEKGGFDQDHLVKAVRDLVG
ncbi:MAG: response regulator, partial [Candidatus Sericytochromatia bacterium]|nr:response regulator [Candidatus Tanganyikabacteria bacterium]